VAAPNPSTHCKVVSPFISFVSLESFDLAGARGVQYTIVTKPGPASRPVRVEYSLPPTLTVPVFGLYSGYENLVSGQGVGWIRRRRIFDPARAIRLIHPRSTSPDSQCLNASVVS